MKKLSNTDAELKKCVAYKKACNIVITRKRKYMKVVFDLGSNRRTWS